MPRKNPYASAFERAVGWVLTGNWLLFLSLGVLVVFSVVWRSTPWGVAQSLAVAALLALPILAACQFASSRTVRHQTADAPDRARVIAIQIALLGALIRIAWQIAYPYQQVSDALEYVTLARNLIENGQYYYVNSLGQKMLALRSPGYPLVIAALIGIGAPLDWAPVIANLAIYGATCALIYTVASAIATPSSAVLAMALFALYPSHVAITGIAETEGLSLLLLLIAFWLVVTLERRSIIGALMAGTVLGFAALTRPTFILLIGIASGFLALLMVRQWRRRGALFSIALRTALLVLGFGLVVGAWGYRNYLALGAFVPTTTMGGLNFYFANNPVAHTGIDNTERDILRLVPDEIRRSEIGYQWGMEWIRGYPMDFMRLSLERLFRMTGNTADPFSWVLLDQHEASSGIHKGAKFLANSWWFVVWAMALFSLVRHRQVFLKEPWAATLLVMCGFLFAVHMPFQSVARYNIPLAGLLIVLSSASISSRLALPGKGGHRG